jgi:hypothetical protein
MSLHHLTGLTRLECHTPGFPGIPAGTVVPLRVWKETILRSAQVTAADGSLRLRESSRAEMLIEITGPDGTRHRFHTDPDSIAPAAISTLQPAGRATAAPIQHHPIATFVAHFHTPIPPGTENPRPKDHALLDLLEAITLAALQVES